MKQRLPPRIVATRHEAVMETLENPRGVRLTRVLLGPQKPTLVCQLQAIMGGWWQRSGGYPVGRDFGTRIG